MTAPQTVADVQHTPGPWLVTGPFDTNDYDDSEGWYRIEAARTLDLRVCRSADGYVEGENEANARLIAAAPDLLKALQSTRKRLWFIVGVNDPSIVEADAALRAAATSARQGETK